MPRGGSRKHPADCKCGNCPKIGRTKQERPTNANVATRVLAKVKAEQTWLDLIELEKERLGLNLAPIPEKAILGPYSAWRGNVSIIPLVNVLRYLEDRAYGRPMDTVNHLHDKPIEHKVTISMSELVRKVRERKEHYERSRS
jgi:hypothetical protein